MFAEDHLWKQYNALFMRNTPVFTDLTTIQMKQAWMCLLHTGFLIFTLDYKHESTNRFLDKLTICTDSISVKQVEKL